jgi:hypothetical protein
MKKPSNETLERIGVIVIWLGVIAVTCSIIVVEQPATIVREPCECAKYKANGLPCCENCKCGE